MVIVSWIKIYSFFYKKRRRKITNIDKNVCMNLKL